ncbi:MAG TPA: thiol:disulfide interchange protein DsbA/DsbL [Steroidobacteraceae bacterium]|nr:thiol:disulfide interchange protein DsbA/DsbL [Steroidobacteraceae bacterium]
MVRSLALALLAAVCIGACTRGSPGSPATTEPQPPSATGAIERNGTGAQSSAVAGAPSAAAADAASQSSSSTAEEVPGTTSLEHLAALPPGEQLPEGRWKAGTNYNAIVPAQPTSVPPGKVEVLEVFWLGCPHCYALEPYIQRWLNAKPAYVQFVRVPVMWGPFHRAHAQLFYTLESLGRDDLVEKAFDTIHRDHNPLLGTDEQDSFNKQLAWAQANGIDASTFRAAYNSFGVHSSLEHAQEITDRYQVESVPLVIIDGKFSSDVDKAGGQAQLIQLIDDLAAFEHRRPHRG